MTPISVWQKWWLRLPGVMIMWQRIMEGMKDWRLSGEGGWSWNRKLFYANCFSNVIKMQIHSDTHTHTHYSGVGTRGEDAVSSSVRPANDLPHLLQCDVFQQHKDRSHLIGEPAVTSHDQQPVSHHQNHRLNMTKKKKTAIVTTTHGSTSGATMWFLYSHL